MAPERLSSRMTGVLKFGVMPLCTLASLASGVTQLWLWPSAISGVAVLVAFATLAWVWRLIGRCREVCATEAGLRVTLGHRVVEVGYREIVDVTEFRWSNPRRISVALTAAGPLGARLTFLATRHGGFGAHPVVARLRGQAGLPPA
jgi:hypothetical protein